MILILDNGREEFNSIKLDFNEVIDISQFVLAKDKPQITYSLYGVITFIENNYQNSNFVASCKNIDSKWYRFDDTMITPINNFQNEVIDFGIPYILFYQKNN